MNRSGNSRDLLILLGVFAGIAAALHLGSAASGNSIYRGQHLGTALEYARGPIDPRFPVIVGFNANGAPTPQEFPLWQAAAGLAMKLAGEWFGWANLVSLCCYLSCLWPFHRIAVRALGSARAAWWAVVFFASQPLVVVHAGMASTDILCLALAIWFVHFGMVAIERGTPAWWGAAAVAGALCAVSKLPFFMASGLALAGLLLGEHRADPRRWAGLGAAGLVATAAFAGWTRHTEAALAAAELPYIDLRISANPAMAQWYFGTLAERLDPGIYMASGWKFLNATVGSFALAAVPLAGFCARRARFPRVAFLAAALTTMVFFNLVTVHRHYYLLFSPAIALAAGSGADLIERAWRGRQDTGELPPWIARMFVPVLGACLLASLVQGSIATEIVGQFDGHTRRVAGHLAQHTAPSDKLVIHGASWGGDELFTSGREGLSLRSVDTLVDSRVLARLRELGYTKLICVSESPLVHALQVTNPGGGNRRRRLWSDALKTPAAEWERVFSNEDVLIARLPGASDRP